MHSAHKQHQVGAGWAVCVCVRTVVCVARVNGTLRRAICVRVPARPDAWETFRVLPLRFDWAARSSPDGAGRQQAQNPNEHTGTCT